MSWENLVESLYSVPWFKFYVFLLVFWVMISVSVNLLAGLFRLGLQLTKLEIKHPQLKENSIKLKKWFNQSLLMSMAISYFGLTVGIVAGNSRTAITDTVITTILSIYGGLSVYWFSRSVKNRSISAFSLIVFSIFLIYGAHNGALNRVNFEKELKAAQKESKQKMLLFESDLRIYEYSEKKGIDVKAEEFKKKGTPNVVGESNQ